MTDGPVALTIEDGLARLTLNRPDAGNALTPDLAKALLDAALTCRNDPTVRAVLMTGTGKNFCVGGDLRTFHGAGDGLYAVMMETTTYLHAACSHLARMDAPLVIAVQGAAAGAGISIALLGDLVYAADSAFFCMAYTAAGLSPDGGSTFLLPRVVGLRRAQELTLTNRRLTAAEAVDWGLATKALPDEEVLAAAEAQAKVLAKGPTRAYGRARRLLIGSFENTYETQMEAESVAISTSGSEPDGQAGIKAFLNKENPTFSGRIKA